MNEMVEHVKKVNLKRLRMRTTKLIRVREEGENWSWMEKEQNEIKVVKKGIRKNKMVIKDVYKVILFTKN